MVRVMVRVVVLVFLSLTLVGMSRAEENVRTCAGELSDKVYTSDDLRADLVDEAGTTLGSVVVSLVPRKDGKCFRATFTASGDGVSLLKLRGGLFTIGEILPTGKERFTRRKKVAVLTTEPPVLRRAIDICPDRILIREGLCCGLLEFFAFAVMRVSDAKGPKTVRAYLTPSELTNQRCEVADVKKPFRYVCTLENSCEEPCDTGFCRGEEGGCISLKDATRESCPVREVCLNTFLLALALTNRKQAEPASDS
ncbi:hypothetical protein NDN08_004883 [Rhodosorus marinus]|uniref:Carboxypeptidase regulatory-like domain-containing protein n=1 Tax=Rhodosorus marinus TaxID=101924 RepID=A0AAV8UHV1_9RHOD|nr:hypothetical protein NDN08_004883 [Rhodosorus marinus]